MVGITIITILFCVGLLLIHISIDMRDRSTKLYIKYITQRDILNGIKKRIMEFSQYNVSVNNKHIMDFIYNDNTFENFAEIKRLSNLLYGAKVSIDTLHISMNNYNEQFKLVTRIKNELNVKYGIYVD